MLYYYIMEKTLGFENRGIKMLNRKCLDLVLKIIEIEKIIIKDLAEEFAISERSIRYYLDDIRDYLQDNSLGDMIKAGKGELIFTQLEKVREHFKFKESQGSYPLISQEEREEYIIVELIFKNRINLVELSEKLSVSRTTLKNDLKSLFGKFSKNEIALTPDKKGLFLEYDEEVLRTEFLKVILKDFSGERVDFLMKGYLPESFDMNLKNFLHKVEKRLESSISDDAYNTLSSYIKLALGRVECGKFLTKIGNANFLEKSIEFPIVEELLHEIENGFQNKLTLIEKLKLADLLQGSQMSNAKFSYYENWINMEILVQKIVLKFSQIYNQDFTNDFVLFKGLLNHLKPLIYRLRHNQKLENNIYEEVLEQYPKLFQITKESLRGLEDFIQMKLTPEEIAFILMHFKGAIDRSAADIKKLKRILIVCGQGFGTSNLLAQQLEDNYEIEVVDVIPAHRFDQYLQENSKKIDTVITTVPKKLLKTSKDIVEVTAILTGKDREALALHGFQNRNRKISLREILDIVDRNCTKVNRQTLENELTSYLGTLLLKDIYNVSELSKFLPKKNIKTDIEAQDWREALNISGKILVEEGAVKDDYVKSMIEVVENFGSYIVIAPNFAMPHSRDNANIFYSSSSLIKLKKEVMFPGDKPVRLLFTFSSKDNKEHLKALSELTEILSTEGFIEKIMECKTADEIFNLIN